jgi:hypothetical protein
MINGPAITERPVDLSNQIRHPHLLRLYRYWSERKGTRSSPSRRDIDPLDFPYILGNVLLIDVLRDPLGFRVRLHGDRMAVRAGYELTGKLLEAMPVADYRSYVIERCKGIVETGQPLVVQHNRVLEGHPHQYEALWLPLSDNGEDTSMLLCALVYQGDRS